MCLLRSGLVHRMETALLPAYRDLRALALTLARSASEHDGIWRFPTGDAVYVRSVNTLDFIQCVSFMNWSEAEICAQVKHHNESRTHRCSSRVCSENA